MMFARASKESRDERCPACSRTAAPHELEHDNAATSEAQLDTQTDLAHTRPYALGRPQLQLQRDGELQLPQLTSPFQARRPSLLGQESQLHLDPEIEAWGRVLAQRLAPANVIAAAQLVPITLPPPGLLSPPSTPSTPAPSSTPALAPSTTPATPASAAPPLPSPPIVIPGARPFSLGVILSQPPVSSVLEQAQRHGIDLWNRLSTGDRVVAVSFGATFAASSLIPLLADETRRSQIAQLLNGRIWPIPGTAFNVELNLNADNFVLGIHIDVGRLLPPSFGFRAGIGATPLRDALPEPPPLQRSTDAAGATPTASAYALPARIEAARGHGAPIDARARANLEASLDADLSRVRLHTGSEADVLAKSVQARAFTSGNDIFMRAGAYQPDSAAGQELLAHEAVHTQQQAAGPVSGANTALGVAVSDPQDRFEREARQLSVQAQKCWQ